jgi:hypothetical protein
VNDQSNRSARLRYTATGAIARTGVLAANPPATPRGHTAATSGSTKSAWDRSATEGQAVDRELQIRRVDTDTLASSGIIPTPLIRRQYLTRLLAARTAAAIAAATAIAACGSSSPGSSSSGGQTNPKRAQAQQDTLNFARCMRSHGVSNFPDDLHFQNVPGIDPSAPAFTTAQTACRHLLPVKTPPPAAPSAQIEATLLRLSNCLRAHGYPSMPDPKPNPPPQGGSPGANSYSALFGEGDYWIGIPKAIDAHGAAFIRALHVCHARP